MLSSMVAHRVGWALLHSLWQLVVIWAASSLLLVVLRHRSAHARYVAACAALAAMFVAPIVTYSIGASVLIVETGANATGRESGAESSLAASPAIADVRAVAPNSFGPGVESVDLGPPSSQRTPDVATPLAPAQSFVDRCRRTMSPWTPWLALVWLSGVTLLSLWNLGGWFVARRLMFVGTTPAPTRLADRMSGLTDRIGVAVPVRLLVSSLTQVPVVIGWLRPIILLPLACVSGMSPRQFDAILAHELAHVRRWDYLVNLAQTVVETLLFFHPAVWWISRRIRAEREHCCDDVAVAVCGSRVEYAEALASLEQQRAAVGPAMAARDRRDNTALTRVRRVLGVAADDGVRRTRVLGGVLSVIVLIVLYAGYVAVAGQPESESDETTAAESAEVENDAENSSSDAEKLVEQMRGMSMQARHPRSDGRPDPIEARRCEIIARLRGLGTKAVPALAATLGDTDVQMRRNAALVLIELRGEWTGKQIVDTRAAVPALIKATADRDADVRAWAAHALAEMGPDAVKAVPSLIKLLKDPAEGPRNTSAIALGSIGPGASEAVPALTEALEDESTDVRLFATTALKRIRGEKLAPRPDCLHWVAKDSGEVLFSLDDIVRFDWNRQVFELTRERAMDFMAWQAPHVGGLRREFKVRDSEAVFYEGRAISPVSSIPYDGPTIIEPSTDLPPPLFEIRAGYPEALGETDRRYHPRLQAALAKAGKLAAIPTVEKLNPIAKTSSEWVGERDRMRIRAEIFPETFRIGAKARAHVFFAPQGKNPVRPERIEIHSTLTAKGGTFFCTTDHSVRDPVALSAAFRKGVVVLRWQPWGPVYGAEQSEAKPGPGEIRFQVVLRDAEGKAVGSYKPPAIKVTILPPSDEKGNAKLWSEPIAGLQGRLVVAKPRIGPSEQFSVELQLKDVSRKAISVTHGNPFDFEAQIRDSEDRSIKHTSMRIDVIYSTKTSVIQPQTVLAIPVSIKSIDGAKGSHLDTTTKIWTLPVGKYKLQATYKLPAGQLKLRAVDIEIGERFAIDQISLLIRNVPVATRYKDIEIFEPTPGVAGEWRIRPDVERFPLRYGPEVTMPFGELYYLPQKNVCYIQWDPAGASTLHYYGPIEGRPNELLAGSAVDGENKEDGDLRIGRGRSDDAGSTPASASNGTPEKEPAAERTRGTLSGVVTNAVTGKPLAGAYVAIDHSGDAGGSNLGRFREQGIYVTGETNTEGRFTLENVAFSDQHPFYVTCPGYVRHEQSVAVSKAKPETRLEVTLKPGATVEVTAIDGDKRPLKGETWIRLESKDGPIFVPPREDWPRTTMRTERVKDGRARFGELPAGEYSLDVIRSGPSDDERRAMMRGKTQEEMQAALSTIPREFIYHSGTESISLDMAEEKDLVIPPSGHESEITISIAKDPYAMSIQGATPNQAFVAFVLSRDPGRLLWIGRQFFHPEDHRLGRILRDDFVRVLLAPGQSCRLRNLPPGDYAAFVYSMGRYPNFKSPALFARAVKLEIRDGVTKTVNIPWADPEGPSFVSPRALMALDKTVRVESRSYSVAELCSLLTATTESRAKFQAAPSSKDRSVELDIGESSIWRLLERLHQHNGWDVAASEDTFTITAPTRTPESP